jgi:hypothetical protein
MGTSIHKGCEVCKPTAKWWCLEGRQTIELLIRKKNKKTREERREGGNKGHDISLHKVRNGSTLYYCPLLPEEVVPCQSRKFRMTIINLSTLI